MQWNGRVTTESTSPTKPKCLFSRTLEDKFVILCERIKFFLYLSFLVKNEGLGASLVVQWLRVHLPMQGTWV